MSHSPHKTHLAPPFCEICGFSAFYQRHRIRPGRHGGKYRVGNVIALCPNHHGFADSNQLTPPVLFQIVRERLGQWLIDEKLSDEVFVNSLTYIDQCLNDLGDRENFDE